MMKPTSYGWRSPRTHRKIGCGLYLQPAVKEVGAVLAARMKTVSGLYLQPSINKKSGLYMQPT
jgi:hypothetical protein